MNDKFVYLDEIQVYDDVVFTEARAAKWKKHIVSSYDAVRKPFEKHLGSPNQIRFFLNEWLLDEVVIDAIIGMRKITSSSYNSVEDPNSFKIAAYLSYWWMRHKPCSIFLSKNFNPDEIDILVDESLSPEEQELEKQKFIWQLKHINELVAVNIVTTFIFDFTKNVCGTFTCKKVKMLQKENFCFNSFEDMRDVIIRKLTYYFCYRTIAPKVIEHILEGYTFHPAWALTGPQWNGAQLEGTIN